MNKKLSIIVPVYNEVQTVSIVLDKLKNIRLYENFMTQIIVVDDNSNDGTKELLKELEKDEKFKNDIFLYKESNMGKGNSQRLAIPLCEGEFTIIQDADLEYDPLDYEKLLRPFFEANADIVYGSRFLGGGKYVRIHFFWHYLANKILTFICNLFTNLNLTDMETGYKVFKSSALKSISLKEESFSFEPEVTIKLSKKKFKFFEVPITYNGRSYDEGKKIGLKDAFIALKTIILYSLIG
jgi:glycosyltransferase involved in cell wall biosynthesis